MPKLEWDEIGKHLYATGVDHGVLYLCDSNGDYSEGIVWNGLTGVTEKASGGDATAIYADGIKYLNVRSTEHFEATVEAYTYPDEFAECDGSAAYITGGYVGAQRRKIFGFSYRTRIGNDVKGTDYGYKIHLVYGATASPSERAYKAINDNPDLTKFSWDISTVPVEISGYKSAAHIVIDSTKIDAGVLEDLENIIYGTNLKTEVLYTSDGEALYDDSGDELLAAVTVSKVARLPAPSEILALIA